MSGRTLARAAAAVCGALWCWAVLRLALAPSAGLLEGAVAAGGWGLSLLPVHCAPAPASSRIRGTSPRDGPRRTGR
ncbi:hypothetical protein ACFV0R_22770 [Streptomyces sp. NPDC059578]|uniref:hypothetical protein n=1 Tax=Streptomyces sp. NPDC059578 TaxID=3346874 RepID=UPI0036B0168A